MQFAASFLKHATGAFILAIAAGLAGPAIAAGDAGAKVMRQMTMTGIGEVRAAPDRGHISLGVITEQRTADQALASNTVAMQSVMASLKAAGIAPGDMQTSNFTIHPRYVYDDKTKRQTPRIAGYRVTNTLTITVRELAKMGAVLDAAVRDGSNQMNGIRFSHTDRTRLLDEARRRATADALRKAKLYAEAAGVELGAITAINEVPGDSPAARFARTAALEAKGGAVPISPGEQTLRIQVNITWRLR